MFGLKVLFWYPLKYAPLFGFLSFGVVVMAVLHAVRLTTQAKKPIPVLAFWFSLFLFFYAIAHLNLTKSAKFGALHLSYNGHIMITSCFFVSAFVMFAAFCIIQAVDSRK